MLSQIEKQEMLKDAGNEKRREAFRQTRVMKIPVSFDAYLKFLKGIHSIFFGTTLPVQRASYQNFKL